jgi:hypothetical protein
MGRLQENVGQFYKYYDIKIARLKIKMQDSKEIADSATTMKIKQKEKNLAIKVKKLNDFMIQIKETELIQI